MGFPSKSMGLNATHWVRRGIWYGQKYGILYGPYPLLAGTDSALRVIGETCLDWQTLPNLIWISQSATSDAENLGCIIDNEIGEYFNATGQQHKPISQHHSCSAEGVCSPPCPSQGMIPVLQHYSGETHRCCMFRKQSMLGAQRAASSLPGVL